MGYQYKVKIWSIKVRKNSAGKVTSYGVRWTLGDRPAFYESFKGRTQADSFRSDLVAAQNRGEAFDETTGLPLSMGRSVNEITWFEFACQYVDMKWPDSAASARQTTAEALIRVAPIFMPDRSGKPSDREIRSVLRQWAFNTDLRESDEVPDKARTTMSWCSRNSRPVSKIADPEMLRAAERAVTRRLDGGRYAPTVARKTRSVLSNSLDYAVELNALSKNSLVSVKWGAMPKGNRVVNPESVPNPIQVRTILKAVKKIKRSGPRLEAFFAMMYFAALRPEEVSPLTTRHLRLPDRGWGEIRLEGAHPHVGARWTSGKGPRDKRDGLKARGADEGRTVPCPPELTKLLLKHIERFDVKADDWLFAGEKGDQMPMITYTRTWRAARAVALSQEAQRTPLASRPYDLRHAAVSTWLAAGIAPPTVAKWAGHSVAVLLEIYAACLHGQDVIARKQVEHALNWRG